MPSLTLRTFRAGPVKKVILYNECPFKRVSSNFVTDWCNCEKNVESDFGKKLLFAGASRGGSRGLRRRLLRVTPPPTTWRRQPQWSTTAR